MYFAKGWHKWFVLEQICTRPGVAWVLCLGDLEHCAPGLWRHAYSRLHPVYTCWWLPQYFFVLCCTQGTTCTQQHVTSQYNQIVFISNIISLQCLSYINQVIRLQVKLKEVKPGSNDKCFIVSGNNGNNVLSFVYNWEHNLYSVKGITYMWATRK